MKTFLLSVTLLCTGIHLFGQDYIPKNDGVKNTNTNFTVFINATLHTSPEITIQNGTLLIQKSKIIEVGNDISIPKNSVIVDLKGKHIYASFIDPFTSFGMETPKNKNKDPRSGNPQYEATREGYYWNDHIRPETNPLTDFKYNKKKANDYLQQGFGTLNIHTPDGIARGTGLLVALLNKGSEGKRLISDRSAQFFSFKKSAKSQQKYPTSLMGAMALLRQMYMDADWYAGRNMDTKDISLEKLNQNKGLPQIFLAESRIDGLRADKVGDDSGIQYIIVGGGDEYARIDLVKATNASYIIPLNFPEAYDVSDPYSTNIISLSDMKHWNQAPTNPGVLAKNGITFSFTTHALEKIEDLHPQIKKAIKYGLDSTSALASLTTIPAQLLGKSDVLGSLKKGAYANFLITNNELFSDHMIIYENWVQGHKNVIQDMNIPDINGDYELNISGKKYDLSVTGKPEKPEAELKIGDAKFPNTLEYKNNWMTLVFRDQDSIDKKFTRIIASIPKNLENLKGKVILPDGKETTFVATKKSATDSNKKLSEVKREEEKFEIVPITYPNMAYGAEIVPKPETLLFKNATVWTNESEGILEKTDVLIKNGKISSIGKNLSGNGAKVVDATGKHLTSGIIDEHSHIATAAVNEAGHNSSAEVTIEDVIVPDDIEIYRNLAGGVTTIQVLHGSANPIGGQSAIIKLKWGEPAEKLKLPNSPKFIKFALGENVKQSNWGDKEIIRFPQSRMGVEQVYVDYFTRARDYEKLKNSDKPYRKDIEMETMLEVLNRERFITCHSYIQSEINMLMKLAEKFNFRINTFTHILEGYKVADKMKAHGVGGSTFSDWWAYKYEVNDAIPYNAAIMHNQGVTVAINSDNAEMARRLNQEAAKSVKYGDVSEEDAWKFVTLNPAKLLHIDDRVGSIKAGKEADLVLWSDHPLSIYAKAEKTIIDGAVYFDLKKDREMRKQMAEQKNKLSAMMLSEKNKGLKTQNPKKKEKEHFHCGSL